jgi:MFS transporter, DHA2 family, multidrug resistance protein
MSYLGSATPQMLESWERQESQFITDSLGGLSHRRRMIIMLSVGLVTAIEISNRLSINVILPDLQGNVAADFDQVSWVVILYNLGFLCSMALASWMTRVLGARRHLLGCIALYSVGALGCFLSPHSLESLLIARLIMGFGGGAFLVRTIILAGLMFPGKARIAAVTWLYAVLFFFMITYPIAIGWIADQIDWNYAFLLDFPFLALGAFLVWKFIPRGFLFRRKMEGKIDVKGALFLITALCCWQVATSRGERDEWFDSTRITVALIAAIVFWVLFLWWDTRPANTSPVFHLRMIWRQSAIRTSFGLVLIIGSILGAGLYVLPQYLRNVQDFSTSQTGYFISAYTSGLGLGDVLTLRVLIPRLGGPKAIAIGLSAMLVTFSTFVYIWTPTTPTHILMFFIFLQGLSLSPGLLGAANISTANALPADLNDVSTMFFFLRQMGNTLGVTAVTVMFDRRMNFHSARLLDVANRIDPTVTSTLSTYSNLIHRNGVPGSVPGFGALQIFQNNVVVQSRLLSFIDIYLLLAFLVGAGLILLLVARFRYKSGPHCFHIW